MRSRHGAVLALVLAFVLVMAAACTDDDDATTTSATAAPTTTAAPATTTTAPPPETTTTTTIPEPEEPPLAIPALADWENSPHADRTAEAFRHWDEDDPMVIPSFCAKCHSDGGFQDFLGTDGSDFGTVDADHAVDTVISCTTCHNSVTRAMDSVVMPSGVELADLGSEAVCMQCHQGRQSGVSIAAAVEGMEDDVVNEELGFLNVHYYPAAAVKYGTEALGGFQYDGKTYDAFFTHVEGFESCTDCHSPHSTEIKASTCVNCHSAEDPKDIRTLASAVDYDGDGDVDEGMYYEIEGVKALLYAAIQAYATEVAGVGVVYDSHSYPYFFIDGDGDGEVTEGEGIYPNKYATWTPRLLKAAHNYQLASKDGGAYAHNGKYIIQLLYDSIDDLNGALGTPVSLDALHRIDHGHFAGSEEAFRHWDEDDPAVVSSRCSRCHTAAGLPLFLTEGVEITQDPSNGLLCSTCHNDLGTWSRFESAEVPFPSGATLALDDLGSNLCLNCHQGRSSTNSVLGAVEGIAADTVSEDLGFINIHYFAAGATLFGTDAMGGFEYPGKEYVGQFGHVDSFNVCTECHDAHTLEVQVAACAGCHGTEDPTAIRAGGDDAVDYDGDGDAAEGLAAEITTMAEALYAAIQAYAAADPNMAAIIYDSHAYPYFFVDSNENGVPDPGEGIYPNKYNTWTPRLLQAAYIYQYALKDPGAFAHNGKYVIQMLYDALGDLGANAGMTRP